METALTTQNLLDLAALTFEIANIAWQAGIDDAALICDDYGRMLEKLACPVKTYIGQKGKRRR